MVFREVRLAEIVVHFQQQVQLLKGLVAKSTEVGLQACPCLEGDDGVQDFGGFLREDLLLFEGIFLEELADYFRVSEDIVDSLAVHAEALGRPVADG